MEDFCSVLSTLDAPRYTTMIRAIQLGDSVTTLCLQFTAAQSQNTKIAAKNADFFASPATTSFSDYCCFLLPARCSSAIPVAKRLPFKCGKHKSLMVVSDTDALSMLGKKSKLFWILVAVRNVLNFSVIANFFLKFVSSHFTQIRAIAQKKKKTSG